MICSGVAVLEGDAGRRGGGGSVLTRGRSSIEVREGITEVARVLHRFLPQ